MFDSSKSVTADKVLGLYYYYYYYHEIVHRVHKNNTKIKKLKKVEKANVLTPIIAHTANNFIYDT